MKQFEQLKQNSDSFLDKSFLFSLVFFILLFSTQSSSFEPSEVQLLSEVDDEDIIIIPPTKHPVSKPPKPVEPNVSVFGELDDPEFEPEEISIYEPEIMETDLPPDVDDVEEPLPLGIHFKPKLISSRPLLYPEIARRVKAEGRVVINYILSKEGLPTELKVVAGPALLRESALKTLKTYRFTPAVRNGEPIKVRMTQVFIFKLKG